MKQKGILIALAIVLLIASVAGATYYLTARKYETTEQIVPSPAPIITFAPTATVTPTTQPQPTEAEEAASIPANWLTFENQEYGFEISYPANYRALDDEENLYGWPKAIVLLYGGGQSYDLPIEVWDTVSEYEAKYKNQLDNLTVKEAKGKYITLVNMNRKEEVDQIIATFRPTD